MDVLSRLARNCLAVSYRNVCPCWWARQSLEVANETSRAVPCTRGRARRWREDTIVSARLGAEWEAVSAGTQPTGAGVHPAAIRALQEIGIAHTGRSKSADEFRGVPFDLVVTVCDDAAENCPVWLGQGRRAHLSFPKIPPRPPARTSRCGRCSARCRRRHCAPRFALLHEQVAAQGRV